MIMKIEGFNRCVAIVGFRDVKIEDTNKFLSLVRKKVAYAEVQFFNANFIAGWEHLYFAVLNSLKAFESKQNISNNLAVEVLLYASAQRQIKKAVELLGIKPNSSKIVVLVLADAESTAKKVLETISKSLAAKPDDNVLELGEEKFSNVMRLFDISELELSTKLEKAGMEKKALTDLVIEHVALLAIQR